MRYQPFWTDDFPPAHNLTSDQPSRTTVAIIGSGYTGLHAAVPIAQNGIDVTVLEAEHIGWGASSRNGGMANPGLKLSAPELVHRFGPALGKILWQWSLDAIDHIEAFITTHNIACHFIRSGQVVLAYKPTHFTSLRKEAEWHRQHLGDETPTLVGPAELRDEINSPRYFGGLLDSRAASLHPAKYVFGLAEVAARAGAKVVENTPVLSLRKKEGKYELLTHQGLLLADQVLLATNGYTNHLVSQARRGIFSGGSYIITTEPLSPEQQDSVSPRRRMFYDTKHFLNYFRLTPDGRMLFGGRHNLSIDLPLEQSAIELHKRMVEVFPQLENVPLSHSWTGRLGLTFDLMPHAGQIQNGPVPGVHYAYGYGGHGVAVASYLGNLMGRMLAGEEVANPFLTIPHRRYFFTPYEKLYLPLVSQWFRFLDRIS
jgi:glycine/D-amino acid oxidase-like deaminating enzyme